jgi:hypothetical protein
VRDALTSPPAPAPLPAFLITIDTEGDNAWARRDSGTTRNAAYLHRFQELCDVHGLKPTYLVNYEMARCPTFRALGREVLTHGTGEIGMHLHAWSSPPLVPLTDSDHRYQPFLVEYPEAVIREKIRVMTATLEDTFGLKMVSHRAGRWSLDERYARILIDEGYRVDCSATPLVSWRSIRGSPFGRGGTDYTRFPREAYWIDATDISRAGDAPLLEVPMTIVPSAETNARRVARALSALPSPLRRATRPLERLIDRFVPPVQWLRPNGRNRRAMLDILAQVCTERRGHAEFMLHSSEFMPGGSPTFRSAAQVEALFADLRALFEGLRGRFAPATLAEFHDAVCARRAEGASARVSRTPITHIGARTAR